MILFTSLTVVDEDEVDEQISCGDISIFFKFPAGSNLNDIFLKEKSKYYNFYKKGKCPSYMIEEALENLLDNYLNTYTPEYNQEQERTLFYFLFFI